MLLKKSHCHNKSTRTIAITGGIGCGKSYICQHIEALGYPVFYCDEVAKYIIRSHPIVIAELKSVVGPNVYSADGVLQKKILANYLCKGDEYAQKVNKVVHPRVAKTFKTWCQEQSQDILFMECALLFESGFHLLVDQTILVTCPEELRIQRICQRDQVSIEKAKAWMALQMPEEEKKKRAHLIINNDGNSPLLPQIQEILNN